MRLKTARTIAFLSSLVVSVRLAAATVPQTQPQHPVDPRVSLRVGDAEPTINAVVDRESDSLSPAADQQAVTPEQLAQQEMVRRQEFVFTANKAIFDGDRLKAAGEYEAAAKRYEFALSHLSPGGQMAMLYQRASSSLAAIKGAWADTAMKKGNYEAAARLYQDAVTLDPNREGYQADLMRARRKLQETTGQPLPPPSVRRAPAPASAPAERHDNETRPPAIMPATRTRVEDQDDSNPLPPLKTPPATINTRNHIADPSDMLN